MIIMPRPLPRSHPFARRRRFIVRRNPSRARTWVTDHFTDDDATAIASHTPDVNKSGNPYTGNADILSNTLRVTNNETFFLDLEISDFNLSMRLKVCDIVADNKLKIFLRYKDVNNWWKAAVRPQLDKMRLVELDGGASTVRAESDLPGHADAWGDFTATLNGTSIIAAFDYDDYEDAEVSYTSSLHQSETKFGGENGNDEMYIDDLEITT